MPGEFCYILSFKWISKFKERINPVITSKQITNPSDDKKLNENVQFTDNHIQMIEEDHPKNKNNLPNLVSIKLITEEDIRTIGPAYNSDLVDCDLNLLSDPLPDLDYMNIILKKNLKENIDYIFINQISWLYIEKKFGGFGIKRLVIKSGENIIIENNYLKLKLIIFPLEFTCITGKEYILCSRNWTSDQFLSKIARVVNSKKINQNILIDQSKLYLWRLIMDYSIQKFQKDCDKLKYNSKVEIEGKPLVIEGILDSKRFGMDENILVEIIEEKTRFFEPSKIAPRSSNELSINEIDKQKIIDPKTLNFCRVKLTEIISQKSRGGITGLKNLGNTCYMNSALQCLSHSTELTKYFLLKLYKKEINMENPIGSKGKIANCFYDLLENLWIGEDSVTEAYDLKKVISKKIPIFDGYDQQDSQEFVNSLLDSLHEDLNRIIKKPYKERPEFINKELSKEDELKASDILWEYFLLRNQSIIVDLFYGQLKSRLTCPDCKTISITFDPFLTLSVPIPNTITMDFLFIPYDFSHQHKIIKIVIGDSTTFNNIEEKLINLFRLEKTKILFCLLKKCRIKEIIKKSLHVSQYNDYTILAYEVSSIEENSYPLEIGVEYMQRSFFSSGMNSSLYPKMLMIKNDQSLSEILKLVNLKINELTEGFLSRRNKIKIDSILEKSNDKELFEYEIKIFNNLPTESSWIFFSKKSNCEFCKKSHEDNCSIDKISKNLKLFEILESMKYKRKFGLSIQFPQNEYVSERISDYFTVSEYSCETINLSLIQTVDALSLENCLKGFGKEEQLDEENMWNCPTCKKPVQAYKKMEIYKLPKILIIHLKRFAVSRRSGFISAIKNTKTVYFPLTDLKLETFCSRNEGNNTYDLFAVSNHYGGMGGGHYTAICYNPKIEQWVEFDDSSLSKSKSGDVLTSAAYLLFYRKVE